MRRNRGWAALRTALTAAALGGLVASPSLASSAASTSTTSDPSVGIENTFTYSTSGQIDPTTGVTSGDGSAPVNVISFDSVPLDDKGNANNSFLTPSNFNLGAFRVGALPTGKTTIYNNTPFSITFLPQSVNGQAVTDGTPLVLKGVINGTVTGGANSQLVATFLPQENTDDPKADPFTYSFKTSSGDNTYTNTLRLFTGQNNTLALSPSTSFGGVKTVDGQVISSAQPVPEPTTVALFLTAAAGLALRHRLRRKSA